MVYEAEVTATDIKIRGQSVLTSGSVKVDQVHFTFSPDWDGCARTAVFLSGNGTVAVVLDDTNQCYIPKEVLTTTDLSVLVGAFGVRGNITVIPTMYGVLGKVRRGVDQTADNSPEPTPTLMQQTLAQFAADKAITAADRQRCDQDAEATAADRQAVTAAGQAITAEGARQVDAVQTAGAAQVLAVQNKGAEVIAAVDAKKTAADQSAADAQQSAADAALAKTQAQAAAGQTALDVQSTAQDKTATAADRQAVAQDKQTVVATGQQVAVDAGQVSADKIAAESAKAAAEAAQAAIGINGANMFVSPIWQKASGASVSVTPAVGSNFEVQLNGATTQPGTGDPGSTNVRPIYGAGKYDLNIVFTGSESWVKSGSNILWFTNAYPGASNSAICTDFKVLENANGNGFYAMIQGVKCVGFAFGSKSGFNTSDEVKEFLTSRYNKGTPMRFICKSASYSATNQVYCGLSIKNTNGYHGYAAGPMAPLYDGDTVDFATGECKRTKGYIASYAGEALPGKWISDRDVYAAGATPTTGAQVVYELSTPTTETVPISEPIPVAPTQTDKYNPQPTVIAAADGTVTVGYNMDGTAAYNTLKTAIAALGGT